MEGELRLMLIIANENPTKAAEWLIQNTNKKFVWKQLLELSQCLGECGITKEMHLLNKNQAKEIQQWVREYPCWVYSYYNYLYKWCSDNINFSAGTVVKLDMINSSLLYYASKCRVLYGERTPSKAVWRYAKEYQSQYPTNSLLPIETCCTLYKEYIMTFKFKKEGVCAT